MTSEPLNDFRERYAFSDIKLFTEGKNPLKNEDAVGYNETSLVLSDGAADKSGRGFDGRSGGELASELVVDVCLHSQANGAALVAEVTDALHGLYERVNPDALENSAYRFAATMVVARIVGDDLVVTQVADSSFRINGTDIYRNKLIVDSLTANTRKQYIEATGDVEGSRDFIMPLLKVQHHLQNNTEHPLGYGIIDGTSVPEKFIKTYTFPVDSIQSIEIVSDGYYDAFPSEISPESYETLRRLIEEVDPNKCDEYPSTKLNDDRTVLIAHLV